MERRTRVGVQAYPGGAGSLPDRPSEVVVIFAAGGSCLHFL